MMKNIVLGILLIATVVLGYYWLSNQKLSLENVQGRLEKTARGDLSIPISATGEVRPARRVEIKAEASGEIIRILKQPGDRVRAGELIIQIARDDEERSVNRAKHDLSLAEARLRFSELALERARTTDVASAEASVRELEESVKLARFQLDKFVALGEEKTSAEELLQKQTTLGRLLAQLDVAKARLGSAKLAIPQAEEEVKQMDAGVKAAQSNLADAEDRLAKTDIYAPLDGIVSDIPRQIGEVIQSAKTTFTAGTLLGIVVNLDRVIVRAEVDEADIGRVLAIAPEWAKPGAESTVEMPDDLAEAAKSMPHLPQITVEAARGDTFEGVIERIYPEPRTLQNVTTYQVDVVVTSDNRDKLLPGLRAEVRFTSEHVSDVVLVPNEAIREGPNGRLGVYVPKAGARPEDGQTQFVDCVFGLDNGNYSEVRDGLKEGQQVYTRLPVKEDDDDKKKSRSRARA